MIMRMATIHISVAEAARDFAALLAQSMRTSPVTERRHGYQNNLDTAQKPYYCVSKYPYVSAVLPRRPCLALHRRALPVHLPPTTGKASALVAVMTWV
jgi:hypothetical protein